MLCLLAQSLGYHLLLKLEKRSHRKRDMVKEEEYMHSLILILLPPEV
jgi:hypothetical protein